MNGPRGYAAGIAGLAEYIGKSPKATRALLSRVAIPAIRLPGIARETVLYKLTDVDDILARYRDAEPRSSKGVDIDALVDATVADVVGPRRTRGRSAR